MAVLVLMFVVIGVFCSALAIPLIREKVKPNWFYGFRTPKTVNNPHIWYPANKRAGWWLLGMGVMMLWLGLILPLIPGMSVGGFGGVVGFAVMVFLPLMMVDLLCYLSTLS